MKILIGYDGSQSADAALDDLRRAGLPGKVEVSILTVAEIWMPPTNGNDSEEFLFEGSADWVKKHERVKQTALKEAESLNRHAREKLTTRFPDWRIHSSTAVGSPARKILENAEELFPDLIVAGAQGRSAISRLFFGSISGKLLAEAKCSVRIARARTDAIPQESTRIIIGFDGSHGSLAAVQAVAARKWREPCEIRLVTAVDPLVPDNIGRFMTPSVLWVEEELRCEREWIEKIARPALLKLSRAGLHAELTVETGNPKQILIDEAGKWNADCVFVGANQSENKLEKFVIGSVAAAVAERAPCSVEAVRKKVPC